MNRAKFALALVGVAAILLAVLGLLYNAMTVTLLLGDHGDEETPYFRQAFFVMSAVCVACYVVIAFCGIQFVRQRPGGVWLFGGILILEMLYFMFISVGSVVFMFWRQDMAAGIAGAMGVANGGLSPQLLTLFPLWAPLVAGWAARRIRQEAQGPEFNSAGSV